MNKSISIRSPIEIDSSGWKKILKRVMGRISEDHIPIVSAGVAFYAFLAIFPGVMALFSIYGLVTDAQSAQEQIRRLAEIMPALAIIVISAISLIYQHGPARDTPRFRWVVLGATVATVVWLIASWGFSVYVNNFGNFGEMYGSLSAVVILLFWLFITSFIILVGGELNRSTEAYAGNRLEMSE